MPGSAYWKAYTKAYEAWLEDKKKKDKAAATASIKQQAIIRAQRPAFLSRNITGSSFGKKSLLGTTITGIQDPFEYYRKKMLGK